MAPIYSKSRLKALKKTSVGSSDTTPSGLCYKSQADPLTNYSGLVWY